MNGNDVEVGLRSTATMPREAGYGACCRVKGLEARGPRLSLPDDARRESGGDDRNELLGIDWFRHVPVVAGLQQLVALAQAGIGGDGDRPECVRPRAADNVRTDRISE